ERASRYAASAGSEEIELLPDDQENDENQVSSDDEFSPSSMRRITKEIKKRVMASEQLQSPIELNSPNFDNQTTTTSIYDYSRTNSSLK
ncbi:unnamed protein product, partial [Rotaria magnacalcarata]